MRSSDLISEARLAAYLNELAGAYLILISEPATGRHLPYYTMVQDGDPASVTLSLVKSAYKHAVRQKRPVILSDRRDQGKIGSMEIDDIADLILIRHPNELLEIVKWHPALTRPWAPLAVASAHGCLPADPGDLLY